MSYSYTNPAMKNIIKLLFLSLAGIITIFGLSKKEKNNAEQDAVRLPEFNESAIVEDYEIAAYHNQA
ncbi:MAG: hypothetical protein RL766_848 [Bacteroidota bacterium]